MIRISKQSQNRVDIGRSGENDADPMDVAFDDLTEKSGRAPNGHMHCLFSEFEPPTPGTIGVEMVHLPKLTGLLRKSDKCAVLSGSRWLHKAAEVEGAVSPGIEIRGMAFRTQARRKHGRKQMRDGLTDVYGLPGFDIAAV